ncbi:KpsF/GutQ family sugar-phosphate isomerase [Litorivicinus lipolyticus]|uniref:Arabinose 5-phosphate isomerase n=1 Tax=Litorivicinus lipolyticus TaxID=418701 RepID=A0A5Q2Q9M6_9GAMM|nr:KpsF/GutQ family sugar-phosphate isomerase [Litorivicinus lipolyticus]QGG80978.1 KpsF/GutQ family sugar-phosphate isomerase [Litorivicinus lipolyticus]
MSHFDYLASARRTLTLEADAITDLAAALDPHFERACELILACTGRVIVTGMGKSGHIGTKLAATLASTGTPAFFVHPGEASHGDMGMITKDDVVIGLSNSGSSGEVVAMLPLLARLGSKLVGISSNPDSPLGQASHAHLTVAVKREACPLNLAPTSSTTAALAMGDALAIALLEARGFTADDFAFSHPGGALGRRLLMKVDDLMHAGDALPCVSDQAAVSDAIMEVTRGGLGITAVTDVTGKLIGVFTDGDLRRALDKDLSLKSTAVNQVMTAGGQRVKPGTLAAEAVRIMQETRVNAVVVTDNDRPIGILNMHDLMRAGVV